MCSTYQLEKILNAILASKSNRLETHVTKINQAPIFWSSLCSIAEMAFCSVRNDDLISTRN